ncbi:MAG: tRNA (adenosine(37)-N6)-threonylcarbamoyltransferase complex dimerization subunit type 1 TsaB [Burkholderiaceae bacterium]|nr:MAG: tRNA (adenosine(37)-N6)-threonylcarbamoyltransferase complex dimerization subunit type 1 TsaB [Burkholderiaceae bacterium]
MPATLVCLDTSTDHLSLSLSHAGQTDLFEAQGAPTASSQLLPQLQQMMQRHAVQGGQVQAVAFGRGPGAFTGLRTSASIAQGLALGWGCPVIGVDSLMSVAELWRASQPAGAPRAWVAMDARMDEIYAAAYQWDTVAAEWLVCVPPSLYALPVLRDSWANDPAWGQADVLLGNAAQAFGERLPLPTSLDPARVAAVSRPHALGVQALAQRALARGEGMDPALALPLYVRDKVAQTTAEREAQKAAAQP